MRRGGRGYAGRAAPPPNPNHHRGGRVRVTSEELGQGRPPIGGAESEPPGPAFDSCARVPFVGGGGCAWVQCPCGGSGSHTGRWVLGWRWCLQRVVWLSAAIIVVHCFALFCCTVCCVLSCAGKFRYVSLPAPPPLGGGAMPCTHSHIQAGQNDQQKFASSRNGAWDLLKLC